jgi:single-stranded DNA-binding protein
MSLHAAFYGQAFKDSEVKISKSGSQYGSVLIAVADGQDEDGKDKSLFIRLLAFQENIPELAKIKRGDRVYAEGAFSVAIYQSEKGPRPDLTLKAHHVRRTAIGKDKPKRETSENHSAITPSSFAGPRVRERPEIQGRDRFDFNDELPI